MKKLLEEAADTVSEESAGAAQALRRMAAAMPEGHKIVTEYVYPPIPERSMDWSAVFDNYDGAPDAGGSAALVGRGPTELSAIADLLEQEHERTSHDD